VTVRNPLHIITLPWSEIDDFVPGSFALRINATNAEHIGVWAVQRANAAKPGRSVVDLLAIRLCEVQRACKSDSAGESTRRLQLPWVEVNTFNLVLHGCSLGAWADQDRRYSGTRTVWATGSR
jgi:hypothetical protein